MFLLRKAILCFYVIVDLNGALTIRKVEVDDWAETLLRPLGYAG